MGLLDGTTQQQYYKGNNLGNYQFVSLQDIINQFMVIYIGEGKIISKASRIDVAFHAQRALAELSFDTFKSVKSQEIVLPATLQMLLPHDYVNYTKISWSDAGGIKHPLYPTKHTSNPFSIKQDDDGNYSFANNEQMVVNADFEDPLVAPWQHTDTGTNTVTGEDDAIGLVSGALTFTQFLNEGFTENVTRVYAAWQELDVSNASLLEISADGTSALAAGDANAATLRFGISSTLPDTNTTYQSGSVGASTNVNVPDLGYVEWSDGEQRTTQTLTESDGTAIDVSNYNTVYVLVTCFVIHTGNSNTTASVSSIDNISVTNISTSTLSQKNNTGHSESWKNYKSLTPSENQNDDYEDEVYWPYEGERYGLEPSHAQINGSFYIDDRLGKIHFSSNVSGKTVILDYISDSLGTDAEMKVHKLAEDAMYKHILCDLMSGRANVGRGQLQYYKKDKFAAVRKAKLRLSNIKLEELTQILRGKSKLIKH